MNYPHSKQRTYARNRKHSLNLELTRRGQEKVFEGDSVYFLKLVLCVVLATVWIKFHNPLMMAGFILNGLPLGMLVGFILVRVFEKYQQNRKIWYVVLILVTVVCYFNPAGIVV